MSTIRYHFVKAVVSLVGGKRLYTLGAASLKKTLDRMGGKQNLNAPAFIRRKFDVQTRTVSGYPCHIVSPREKSGSGRAMLYIHAGGWAEAASVVHWLTVARLAGGLGIPVWMPLYPLIPVGSLQGMNAMILEVYGLMLKNHAAADITVAGDSAGASLSLTLCHHIKRNKLPEPLPGKLILISPAAIGERDPAIVSKMREIERFDVLLGCEYMFALASVCGLDISHDNYYTLPSYGDFTGFPQTHIFSGTHDIFYPQSPPMAQRMKDAGVNVTLHTAEGMMHDWPLMPLAPECTATLDEIMEIVRN
jgi:acetyl esterase/lipase